MEKPKVNQPILDKVKKVDNPAEQSALARADAVVQRAQLNEALKVVDELLAEVGTMHISNRFRTNRTIGENSLYDVPAPLRSGMMSMNEPDAKRIQLESNLRSVSNTITAATARLHSIVMDIEAAKVDEKEPLKDYPRAGRTTS